MQHVAGITEAAKETQPEAYIVGEHFGDARQWLQADVEDAAMNYRGFTISRCGDFLPIPISLTIRSKLMPKPVWLGWIITAQGFLINNNYVCLISSTATILRDLKRCSVGILRACRWRWSGCSRLGVPCIYYGDEVGLDGKTIRFAVNRSRRVEKQDTALFALYQRMIALRKKSQALRRGGCQVLYAEDNVVVFVRDAESATCTGGNQPWRGL